VTGWDVFSDAVKIGLPLLLGGAVSLFSFRVSRRHAERTERKKRTYELLGELTRAVCRWHDAVADHNLYCRDEYFKRRETKVLPWLEGNLATLERVQRSRGDLEEFRSLLLVHNGFGFTEQLGDLYAAYNAVHRAFAEPGKTDDEISALETKANEVYNNLLRMIHAAHQIV
jgi:hypothetical protein